MDVNHLCCFIFTFRCNRNNNWLKLTLTALDWLRTTAAVATTIDFAATLNKNDEIDMQMKVKCWNPIVARTDDSHTAIMAVKIGLSQREICGYIISCDAFLLFFWAINAKMKLSNFWKDGAIWWSHHSRKYSGFMLHVNRETISHSLRKYIKKQLEFSLLASLCWSFIACAQAHC